MRPLILITNDDSVNAQGIKVLSQLAREFGDVVVVAPERNSSGLSHSFTMSRPLRVREVHKEEGLAVYACDGTPVDCVKIGYEEFCPRRPRLVLSGINHGSNASTNVIYSGTMGSVIEATTNDFDAIGFSHLSHLSQIDFEPCLPYFRQIIEMVMQKGLPQNVSLNVNFPDIPAPEIRGLKVCHEAKGYWKDGFEKRIDPYGNPYWWVTGTFVCDDQSPDCDVRSLEQGYVTIVPTQPDYTCYNSIPVVKQMFGMR